MNPRFLAPDLKFRAEFGAIVFTPIERLMAAPDWAKLVAASVGVGQFLYNDLLSVSIAFMLACAAGDWYAGTKVAKLDGVYSSVAATRGTSTKVISLILVGIVWLGELVIRRAGGDTGGMLTVIAAVAYGVNDAMSMVHHREALGAGRIPIVSAIIERIGALMGSKLPPGPPTPQRRAGEEDSA